MKECKLCKITKDDSEFYKNNQRKFGLCDCCKECTRTPIDQKSKVKHKSVKSSHFTGTQISELVNNCRKRSNIKKYDFNLNQQNLSILVHEFCETHLYNWSPKHPFKPSVDRIDNSKGYTIDNIRITWLIENYCRNTFTEEQVIQFCIEKLKLLNNNCYQ